MRFMAEPRTGKSHMSDSRVEKNGKIEMNGFPLHECLRCRDISFGVTNKIGRQKEGKFN
jgi:hypothetical protein